MRLHKLCLNSGSAMFYFFLGGFVPAGFRGFLPSGFSGGTR